MKIFLSYHPSGNLSVPGSKTWYKNLHAPLIDIGHEVFPFRMDEVSAKYKVPYKSPKFKQIFSSELKRIFFKEHERNKFDVFLSYFTKNIVCYEVLNDLKKAGIPMLNFSCNNTHQFHLVSDISTYFDYNLHSEKDAADKFYAIKANPVWFPMSANPNFYFPQKSGHNYDVSFIGAAYAKRAYYIDHLVKHGINVNCFGPNWLVNKPNENLKKLKKEFSRNIYLLKGLFTLNTDTRVRMSSKILDYDILVNLRKINLKNLHYPVTDSMMVDIINQSKINLGFLEVYSGNNLQLVKQHVHLREFEIPMCGGLYFTNYSDELSEFYDPGKEIITFMDEHELQDKISFFLSHESIANQVRESAYKRAISCHTSQNRYKQLFNQLNLK